MHYIRSIPTLAKYFLFIHHYRYFFTTFFNESTRVFNYCKWFHSDPTATHFPCKQVTEQSEIVFNKFHQSCPQADFFSLIMNYDSAGHRCAVFFPPCRLQKTDGG